MPTIEEIKAKHKQRHDELSDAYYSGASGLTKQEFDTQHGKIWDDMEAELIAGGFMQPPKPIIDWQAEWAAASPADRVEVVARMLGLEVK